MNKRAQARLIGVTAIILIAVGALIFGVGKSDGAYSKTVKQVAEDKSLVGERVRVQGAVVPGSWNKRSNPMVFQIREENSTGGPTLEVSYGGRVPETFGDNVTAIITGELQDGGKIDATDMFVKCPSKYESSTGSLSVAELISKESEVKGRPVRVSGVVVDGSIKAAGGPERLRIRDANSDIELPVAFDGGLSDGVKDGASVVIGGSLDENGVLDATAISLNAAGK